MITKYRSRAPRAPFSKKATSAGTQTNRQAAVSKNSATNRQNNPDHRVVKTIAGKTPGKDEVRVIVLGGLEEVGRNMTLLECNQEIIIIDMGLQFPEEDMPGIDYIIPNISYLKGKEDWIKGIIITHAHYDHIGGIPHLMAELGNPPMFMGKLTAGIVKKRCVEYQGCPALNISLIDEEMKIQLGSSFNVGFFRVNHSIPDCFAVVADTPMGKIIHTGDFKIDYSPVNDQPADLQKIANIGSQGVRLLMSDSTDATHPGYQISESAIGGEMDKLFEKIEGRIIVGTFASQLARIQKLLDLSEKHGRRVYLQGRSMNDNVELAHQTGYLKFNPKIFVKENELKHIADNKLLIIGTGAQGESNAFLNKVVSHEHRSIFLKKGDTVIFSSSAIPGNERSIQSLKDMITRQGAYVIHYAMMDIHAGGHAKQEDLKLMMRLIKPEFLMPIEGNHFLLKAHAELAEQVGIDPDKIFVADNGQVVSLSKNDKQEVVGVKTTEKVPADYVFVDGLGVGDISHIVLRDRRAMSEDGMVVIIATVDHTTGKTIGNPDIISRGFVYMKESRELIETTRMKAKKLVESNDSKTQTGVDHIKNKIRDEIGQFLFMKTKRRPMVLPVVIKV